MKKFLKFSLILALAVFTFSCSNDNTDVIPEDPQANNEAKATIKSNMTDYARNAAATGQAESMFENNDENNDMLDDCFTLNFPYTVTNGNTVATVNSQAEAENFFNAGYMLAFPVDVTTADGEVVTIQDELGFIELLEDCFENGTVGGGNPGGGGEPGGEPGDPFGNDCFEYNFPLSVATIDGNTVVVNDEYELFTVEGAIGFVYPITVSTENGDVTINSDEDFDALYNDCYDIDPCDDCVDNCFEIVFPLTLIDDAGNVTTVNDDDEFITYLDGLDNNTFFTITFPMTIEYEDGTQATINSEDELIAAFDACN
ncbi:hypothetical protein [uncultured Kordia sp.]|uniref:hypothetical protein n=1 Tax=uncultured Kordia sp. TaxID=507699 RepID=UPI00261C97CB|nr:hypothetical protein [uncultured Kordia sp.]